MMWVIPVEALVAMAQMRRVVAEVRCGSWHAAAVGAQWYEPLAAVAQCAVPLESYHYIYFLKLPLFYLVEILYA
jgi:hypothetical protein